jgi:hypothetical protein
MNFIEDLGINGHLTISKLFKDGSEELIFDDHNIIVSGMGVGLSFLFAGLGSTKVTDFHLDRVQFGVSGNSSLETSTTFQLSGPLSSLAEYGVNADQSVITSNQLANGSILSNKLFIKLPRSKVTRINDNSVRYTIVLDEDAANSTTIRSNKPLNEIGLFMKNPQGSATDASLLVAYRYFSDILKTEDFSLVFRWTINF